MRTQIHKIIEHFEKKDPELAKIISQINYENWFEDKELSSDILFKSLCRTIVGQQLAGAAAKAIFSRFETLLKKDITPTNVLSQAPEKLREVGLSWAKVKSVIDLSTKVLEEKIVLSNLLSMENNQLIEELDQVKGIGRWTAEMFLMFQMGREDIFSWGDLGLNNGLLKFIGSMPSQTKEVMLQRVEAWAPYRTYGAIAMWHLLDQ